MLEWVGQEATNSETSPFSLEARDGDYDTYLFWPSLSNGMGSLNESFVRTNHVDYYSGWDTAPSVCPAYSCPVAM